MLHILPHFKRYQPTQSFPLLGNLKTQMEKSEATKIDVPETSMERKGKAPLLGIAHRARGSERGIAVFDLVLRVSAAAAASAAAIAMGTADETLPFFTQFFQFQASYDDLETFSFFVIAMAIVTGYLALSVPFSIVCIARPAAVAPRLLLLFFDTLAVTLATAAGGAAAAIAYLAHNGNSATNWLAVCQQYTDFCRKVSGAVVASFVAVVLLLFLLPLSALALKKH